MAADDVRSGGGPGFDYGSLVRLALLEVVRKVLARTAEEGLPGDHHLYLTFGTAEAGVELPPRLGKQFPDKMTVVLQHQFWNLAIDDNAFAVTLRFGGAPERLVVPWAALRSFSDPTAGFALRFRPANGPVDEQEAAGGPETGSAGTETSTAAGPSTAAAGKVVELGAFRRRAAEPNPTDE
jgi:hypothetical protein